MLGKTATEGFKNKRNWNEWGYGIYRLPPLSLFKL